ncbi:1-acyl-sn-glycerol-3-phosphate acyltransferase [Polynucleobacter sp. MG-Unter2-18]|uniref:lysophospholipid acyltransferase family protein n=1 Tax=Polynucleobacter sp. MG-Unter2-18 TaxID=2081052 RepID=UPI001BFE8E7B|nr:lysophospholipid acyltransferase family protein [Polynucleobacter sp. MG-Unter2-18]QWD95350.1 1-acyl-sn-glycerol-3-phosphate acyltransferase [Polynucleobacter sp. MG-Unter2-18]
MKRSQSSPTSIPTSALSGWLRYCKWMQILAHVIGGVCILSFLFPWLNRGQKDRRIQQWSQKLLKIFGIRLRVIGAERLLTSPYLLASNHISWLDIHVINAFKPVRFVAKSEVRGWPVFGWMAEQLGTVFIRRDSARHARQVVDQMAEVLRVESVCIFPEGTSTVGEAVLPFKPNLFEAAILAPAPVFPMAIAYRSRSTGLRSDAPAFIGDMGLLESMSNVISSGDVDAHLSLMDPYLIGGPNNPDRKELALYCQEAISKTL